MANNKSISMKNFIKYVVNLPPDEGPGNGDTGQPYEISNDPVAHAEWLMKLMSPQQRVRRKALEDAGVDGNDIGSIDSALMQIRGRNAVRKGRRKRGSLATFWSYGYEQFSRKLVAAQVEAVKHSSVETANSVISQIVPDIDLDDERIDGDIKVEISVGRFRKIRDEAIAQAEADSSPFLAKLMSGLASEGGY